MEKSKETLLASSSEGSRNEAKPSPEKAAAAAETEAVVSSGKLTTVAGKGRVQVCTVPVCRMPHRE